MYKFNGEICTEKMVINGFNVITFTFVFTTSHRPHYSGLAFNFDILHGKVQMVQTSTCCAGRNSLKRINLKREEKQQ